MQKALMVNFDHNPHGGVMYQLFITNKNYSSWSLRPWLLMTELGIAFEEKLLPFGSDHQVQFRRVSPTGKVPCLHVIDPRLAGNSATLGNSLSNTLDSASDHLFDNTSGKTSANPASNAAAQPLVLWESLAITEFLAEHHAGVWPQNAHARFFARCAASEMHAGFSALRNICGMNCGIRLQLTSIPPALQHDLARLDALWQQGLQQFGGPFLAGSQFSAVDAFFAPVAFRLQSYGLELSTAAMNYVATLLALPGMQRWYQQALAETWRDEAHEQEVHSVGRIICDLRASVT
jgi:glutathione S-transferase